MSRKCDLTNIGAQSGNNVSHSNRKTRRIFDPNLQKVSLKSELLKKSFNLRITVATLRTIDHKGGLDNFLLNTASRKLSDFAKKLKKQVTALAEKPQKKEVKKTESARRIKIKNSKKKEAA